MEIYLKEAIYGPYFNSQLFSILNGFKKEDVIPHLDKWPNVKFDINLKFSNWLYITTMGISAH